MSQEWDALKAEARLSMRALLWPLAVMWVLQVVNAVTGDRLNVLGIHPRTAFGLVGIALSPLLHGGFAHLIGNSIAWLIAGGLLALYDGKRFLTIMAIAWLTSGVGAWLTSSATTVVGASGVIFGFFGFVLARGWITKRFFAIVGSLVFGLGFGMSIFGGLVPQPGVAWSAHAFGFLGGVLAAFVVGRSELIGVRAKRTSPSKRPLRVA